MKRASIAILVSVLAVMVFCIPALAFDVPDTAGIVKKVKKSVIRIQNIEVSSEVASGGYGGGSGVLFQLDYETGTGYALTNHHVSGDSVVNAVRFWDGAEYRAELVSREPGVDVCLLKISGLPDERDLPDDKKTIIAAKLGDSDAVQIGDHAIAMGSPGSREGFRSDRGDPYQDYMLQQTVTDGVVTGRDTVIEFEMDIWQQNKNSLGQQYGTNFPYAFRVTVPINPGNSGGPLFNDRGEVIGLNFYGGSNPIAQNENHTVPINFAKDFAYQILNTGKFEKPWAGIDLLMPPFVRSTEAYEEFRERRKSKELEVFGVRKGSAAERAGLHKGDIIVTIDGRTFATPQDVRLYVFEQKIGAQMTIEVKRNGRKLKSPLNVEVQPKRIYDAEFSI